MSESSSQSVPEATVGPHDLRIALFQPDQPGNAGAIIRTAACFGAAVDVIEPAGFALDDRALRRAGMDYVEGVWRRHDDWNAFMAWAKSEKRRLILATTVGAVPHTLFPWRPDDVIVMGRESRGAPAYVHDAADGAVRIPLAPNARSLNVSVAAGIVLAAALSGVGAFE